MDYSIIFHLECILLGNPSGSRSAHVQNNGSDDPRSIIEFSYLEVDDLVRDMLRFDFVATIDIKDTYRVINVHRLDRPRQTNLWDLGQGPELFFDNRLCMGLSSNPFIFNRISDFEVRVAWRQDVAQCVNYFD